MNDIVWFAIEPEPTGSPGKCFRQAWQSWASLRQHDQTVEVHLLYGGPAPAEVMDAADRLRVHVTQVPRLAELIAAHTAFRPDFEECRAWIKHLALPWLPPADRALFCDCDTWWSASPRRLFETYTGRDYFACCEVHTRLFSTSYDGQHVNEDLLAAICASEGVSFIPPTNSGVMLTTRHLRDRLIGRQGMFVDYACRLLGLDAERALPLPSNSRWINDQASLWLVLGSVPGLTWGFLSGRHVPLSNRWMYEPDQERVLSHYFSGNSADFFQHHAAL